MESADSETRANGNASLPREDGGKPATTSASDSHIVIPLYWQRHQRNDSSLSYASLDIGRPPPITLEDHTQEGSDQCKALWARHVTIDDYVIVSGNAPGVGAYVVWNCTVETLDGGPMKIMKRYSEFDELRRKLVKTFPHAGAAMPPLPPKSVISRFRPRFLERRKAGLSYFLKYVPYPSSASPASLGCVLLNPEFSGSPVLKEFLFS
ncbi:PX domain-containing protein [Lepidopterella palustris CBS 459.81]|uniref:Endosomal/vacuolar adapter protein YPT35 n=1 Tax=Lepidopterella palustris CBS 459.81 TaxID=1314670 RepID=A0A8E2JFY3_9PEZI|nr:PX domain-containing protein [Lepidopterella palustris CBS 459.81]